jgi:hypothetical protein
MFPASRHTGFGATNAEVPCEQKVSTSWCHGDCVKEMSKNFTFSQELEFYLVFIRRHPGDQIICEIDSAMLCYSELMAIFGNFRWPR